jgi:hypothetical protein
MELYRLFHQIYGLLLSLGCRNYAREVWTICRVIPFALARGQDEAWLIKTDAEGKEIWNRTFGGARFTQGSNWESENSVQVMSDGGYILSVCAESSSTGVITDAALLIRTDSQGREMWRRIFGGTRAGMAFSVQPTADGGQILVGWTGLHDADAWLIKVAPA